MKEDAPIKQVMPDALGQYLAFQAELEEEKNTEQAICKDLRSIISKGLSLAEGHIRQTFMGDDGIEFPDQDPRWHELHDIREALKGAFIKPGYTTGLSGAGWRPEHIEILREDKYSEINAKLFAKYSELDGLLQAWGVVPMMDKRTAMQILVSKKLMESLDDGRKFEIRTGT